jgi:hypothetical protein
MLLTAADLAKLPTTALSAFFGTDRGTYHDTFVGPTVDIFGQCKGH